MADRTLVMGLCRYEFSWHERWFVRFVERPVVSEDVFVGTEIPEGRGWWGVGGFIPNATLSSQQRFCIYSCCCSFLLLFFVVVVCLVSK